MMRKADQHESSALLTVHSRFCSSPAEQLRSPLLSAAASCSPREISRQWCCYNDSWKSTLLCTGNDFCQGWNRACFKLHELGAEMVFLLFLLTLLRANAAHGEWGLKILRAYLHICDLGGLLIPWRTACSTCANSHVVALLFFCYPHVSAGTCGTTCTSPSLCLQPFCIGGKKQHISSHVLFSAAMLHVFATRPLLLR